MEALRAQLSKELDKPTEQLDQQSRALFDQFMLAMADGKLRAAYCVDGQWQADTLVKRAILLGFRLGRLTLPEPAGPLHFSDKDTMMPPRQPYLERNLRVVPGGTSIRPGSYVGRNVTLMPPAFINVGAYVDDDTMIDSHALVGSCAQVGKRCHISAAAQLGGVLEPIGQVPVVIEDDVFVGGNCGVYEGTIVRAGAVLAAGTILTRGTIVYDLVNDCQYAARDGKPLEIPAAAVLVPGSRAAKSPFAREHGLQLYAPLIVKYRDQRTNASTTLEEALR
ncbi:MAG: 2,3,4,5-tetrahydropyridine-2,6-dicarboxylate N-succinyltransferase [Myxococcota bacterium]|jgi:2,3,4,5-tetrahydropyridine-2-carboxylate N-succinyltransferase|nr:2,3,4,5-tetrahydropyridine-2,6-dicarboxylate N-succinyltransferase [Myxococcota bacterium]